MQLQRENNLLQVEGISLEQKDCVKRAGFHWDHKALAWKTPFHFVASKVVRDDAAKGLIELQKQVSEKSITDSHSTTSYMEPQVPEGLELYDFQKAGVNYMLERENTLLADQMGLGKSIQTVALVNALQMYTPGLRVLVICPASIKINWMWEFEKWSIKKPNIDIAQGSYFPHHNIAIINYDIVARHIDKIKSKDWDLMVLDECHYLKNKKAKRTKAICGERGRPGIEAKKIIALTGTPIVNRPIELFTVLKLLCPHGFFDEMKYARRYCGAVKNHFGWDMTGATNMGELQRLLRSTIMVRRTKEQVLPQLPNKIRQIIEFETDKKQKGVVAKFKELLGIEKEVKVLDDKQYKAAMRALIGGSPEFEAISTIRKENGIEKIPMIIEHLENCIEDSDKIVCFCHHKEVAKALSDHFGAIAVALTGSTSMSNRQKVVDTFQEDPKCKLFIGNIQAAGVGITLTASSHVVFAELSWVPGEVSQAEDRCHRIGQEDSVLVQHLILKGSIDGMMANTIIHKQVIIEEALDISDELREMLK